MTAKKTGSVTITAKSKVNKKVVAKCKIKVYKATKTLKLNSEKSYELTIGQKQALSAKVTNPKKGAAPIEWSSSDEKVAKVSSKGKVTALAEGKATITAKSGKKKVTVSITVKAKETGNETGNTPGTGETQKPGNTPGTGETQTPGNTPGTGETQKPGTNPGNIPSEDVALGKILYSGKSYGMEWFIDENGTFLIRGEDNRTVEDVQTDSDMREFQNWYAYASNIKKAVIQAKNVKSTCSWFRDCYNLKEVDLSRFDTSNVINMSYMFYECMSLTTLDVSGFDTKNVTSMECMFYGCSSLTTLDVSGFDTKNVADMRSMFYYCESLTTLDVSGFDTKNVTDMELLFYECSSLVSIMVPLNVSVNCGLPGDTWQDASGKTYTSLPLNVTESFVITRQAAEAPTSMDTVSANAL